MRRVLGTAVPAALLQLALMASVVFNGVSAARADAGKEPLKPSDLFQTTNIWTVHLQFTPNQWEAMEPKGGAGGMFGGPGGPRRLGGPDVFRGPGGGPGGPGGFGPGMILAPGFLSQGDQDHDGKLSREEFQALAAKWFANWDKEKRGALNDDQIRAGIDSSFAPPQMGPPAGPGPRPGGMNLQGPEGKRNGLASALGIEFEQVHADMQFAGRTFKDVAVRYKGNGTFLQSRGSLKRSFKINLSKYVPGRKLAGITQLNLHNNVTDASWMNEVLSHRLHRDAGVPAPRTAYARVFVTVPGKHEHQYFGLYSIVENVDKHFVEENFGTAEGALFKPVSPAMFTDLGDDWAKYNQTYDPRDEVSAAAKQRVIEFCQFVSKATDAEFAARLGDYIELDEFARFMSVMVWLSDLDGLLGPGQNLFAYLPKKTGKFVFIPWDQDHSFGQFAMRGTQEQRENLNIRKPWQGENRFLERVFKAEPFRKLYLEKMAEFSKGIFRPERFHQQVDEIAAAIRPAVREESEAKLANFDKVVAGDASQPAGPFGGPGGFMPQTKPIKPFVKVRAQSVIDQVAGKSEGQTLGEFGFPGGGRPGGRPGGRGGFGPGMFLGGAFMTALDANKDKSLTREEFTQGFARWFDAWGAGKNTPLTEEQLRTGINQSLAPSLGGPPGGPGFGPQGAPPSHGE